MDQLKKYIDKNRDAFDDQMPEDFLWDRIEKQLNVEKTTKPKFRLATRWVWQAAAAVLIFAVAWFSREWFDKTTKSNGTFAKTEQIDSEKYLQNLENKEISIQELPHVEAYLTSQVQKRQAELEKYCAKHPEILEDLKAEFQEIDKDKKNLQQDLIESQADPRVVEAIIQKYRVKLDILESLLVEIRQNQLQTPAKTSQNQF